MENLTQPKRKRGGKRKIYKLGEFKLMGFSMANAAAGGDTVPVLTRTSLFSADPFFHHCMREFDEDEDTKPRQLAIPGYPLKNWEAHSRGQADVKTCRSRG